MAKNANHQRAAAKKVGGIQGGKAKVGGLGNKPKAVAAKPVSKPAAKPTSKPAASTAAPVGGASSTVQPFLTPDQQSALGNWNASYAGDVQTLAQDDTDAGATYNEGVATDEKTALADTDTTNQDAAARGIFQSSIRDGALNDIASTLAQNNNILQTNYASTLAHDEIQRNTLGGENSATQGGYFGDAVTNAMNVTPVVGSNPTAPKPATGPGPASSPAPVSTKPPTVTGVTTQPQSHSPNPKQPKAPGMARAAGKKVGGITGGATKVGGFGPAFGHVGVPS